MAQDVSDELFSSYPAPLPEQEASRATHGLPQECASTPTSFNLPLQKHRKNQTTLAMSQVCRSWRQRLICSKRLWRVIAFDVGSEPASVRLATLFLTSKCDNTLIHVYAGFPLNNLVDPAVASLLSSLRDRTDRWERFIYWGRLGQYRRYLDLPAPRLRWFSDNRDLSHLYYGRESLFFSGHTPILRCLVASTLGEWSPETLVNLNVLHVRVCDARLSIGLLLGVLRCTSLLEEFKFASPATLLHDCPACTTVDLPCLRSIRLFNPRFRTILAHLGIPNVRSVEVSSVSSNEVTSLEAGSVFQAPHPLTGFPSVPMMNQPVNFVFFAVQRSATRFCMTIDLRTVDGASVIVNLSWIDGQQINQWKGYFERSISALAEAQIAHCSVLSVIAEFPFDYSPLLLLPAVRILAFAGDFRTLLQTLTGHDGDNSTPLLPTLKCLFAFEEILTEATAQLIPTCLRVRTDLIIVLNAVNRACLVEMLGPDYVISGEYVFLATHTLCGDPDPQTASSAVFHCGPLIASKCVVNQQDI